MTDYGPRHTFEDEYGQEVQVDVEMGDGAVLQSITVEVACSPPAPLRTRRDTTLSKQTPDQARKLAKQLEAAAEDAEGFGE